MPISVSIGHTQALNGREAGLQAAHYALNRLGSSAPAFSFVIASHQYQAREVASGVSSLLGDIGLSVVVDGCSARASRQGRLCVLWLER